MNHRTILLLCCSLVAGPALAPAAQGSSWFGDPPPQSTQQYFVIFAPDHPGLALGDQIGIFDLNGNTAACQPGEVLAGVAEVTPTTLPQGVTVPAMGVDVFGCTPGWKTGNPVVMRLWRPTDGTLYELVPTAPPASSMVFGNLLIDFVTAFDLHAAPLSPGVHELSLAGGGSQVLQLDAGPTHAGSLYLLLGSTSGTTPGLPAGALVLPLNPDAYFTFTLQNPGAPPLSGSFGQLDTAGRAMVSFDLPAGSNPALAGAVVHHAYAVLDVSPFGVPLTSNPAALTLLP